MDKEIKFYNYSIDPYYLPPYEYEKHPEYSHSFHYILNVPMPLDNEQMHTLLMMIKEFKDPSYPEHEGITLCARRI